MASLLDTRHGDWVDLQRVITKELSAERAELLRNEPGLAELILGEDAFKAAMEHLWVNGLYRPAEWQVKVWRDKLVDRPGVEIDFDALRASAPAWPTLGNQFLTLVPVFGGEDVQAQTRLFIAACLDGMLSRRAEFEVSELSEIFASDLIRWRENPSFYRFTMQLEWRTYRHSQQTEADVEAEPTLLELLLAVIIHDRWARSLSLENPSCLTTEILEGGQGICEWIVFSAPRRAPRRVVHIEEAASKRAGARNGHLFRIY